MKNTNFSLIDQLGIPSYERRFEDINLNHVFSNEEIEMYSVKKITSLAIMSNIDLPCTIPAYNHLNIIMVSITDVKFNKYLYYMYKKVMNYCKSLCIIVFEKNGALKLGGCDNGEILFTQWIYKDYLTQKVNEFLFGLRTLLNSENLLVSDIAELFFFSIYNIKAEFLSEEQVRAQLKKTYKKKCKSPLFLDYVLSTSFSTYRQAEGYEPRLRYEVSSVTRACEQFAA